MKQLLIFINKHGTKLVKCYSRLKINYFWKYIQNEDKVTLDTFKSFGYVGSYSSVPNYKLGDRITCTRGKIIKIS